MKIQNYQFSCGTMNAFFSRCSNAIAYVDCSLFLPLCTWIEDNKYLFCSALQSSGWDLETKQHSHIVQNNSIFGRFYMHLGFWASKFVLCFFSVGWLVGWCVSVFLEWMLCMNVLHHRFLMRLWLIILFQVMSSDSVIRLVFGTKFAKCAVSTLIKHDSHYLVYAHMYLSYL